MRDIVSLVNRGRGAALERVQVGGKSAVALLSRSARAGNDGTSSGASAWYAVLTVGGRRASSASAHGEHLAGRDMTPRHPLQDSVLPLLVPSSVPLSDIPVGWFKVQGVVSAYKPSAATVTQAGGDECALPAFFAQAPAGKRAGTEEPASGEALRVSETLGGVLGPVGGF